MIAALFHNHLSMLVLSTILLILAPAEAQGNVTVGRSLYADDRNLTWRSGNREFGFGFHPIPGKKDKFLLAIRYAQIPERTIVWYANRDNPETDRGSAVEFIESGYLVLRDPKGRELWRSRSVTDGSHVSHAAMLDTGNFVIVSRNSTNIWESFKDPTDTILPNQELDVGGSLSSISAERNYSKGKYQLRFDGGSLALNQIDMFTGKPYEGYSNLGTGSHLVFNESGSIHIGNSNGSLVALAQIQSPELYYYRATLDFYGVFTLYSYQKTPGGGESWSVFKAWPTDICSTFLDSASQLGIRFGIGPCGYNSICEPNEWRPNCTCPAGFSFLDEKNQYGGCKQDYPNNPEDCSPDGSTIGEDRFEFKSISFTNFPFSDYGIFVPATELECKQSCLRDCSCAVAIFPTSKKDGNATCFKKQLPLFNGVRNRGTLDSTVLVKVLKPDASRKKPETPNQSNDNRDRLVLILGVLLGTSAVFNFFSLAAIALIFFCLFRKRLQYLNGLPSRRDLETNRQFFTYKDLEHATNWFKEEIGRGAFGTVYKGESPSSYGDLVAVKKLDKFAQDGEREFKTEVKVIGQTHHKNLVRLIGYCDEAEHRLLVYEFMENGLLSSFLFGFIRPSWQQRLQIASGIAKGPHVLA
ncbi:Brassinosteroid insensitive 1-associated receptor kinase 1 precursor [Hibiscus syriacus]|uniref:non-specific serine/threonine protein kinase n=1 Tax=Hibiscus syriacus TaxID=106335 RepID=A0A6A3CE96_HIBSY|nr:Brassinosteroid insensitive 1-associated receptor kinase 1 precursor [Hibiscus syriacus]